MNKGLKFGFIPSEGPGRWKEALSEVKYAEELGFDSAWIQERHLHDDNFWPSPLVAASAFLAHTSRLMVGTDILIFPFYNPVRLAEDVAVLDIMSGGRFVLGTAIGYKTDEFLFYDVQEKGRGARFEEGIKRMRHLWTEDERFQPKPLSRPHPKLWIGGWGPLQLKRAALFGDAWLPGVSVALPGLLERKAAFMRHRQEAGLDLPREWPLNRELIIAETRQKAWALAEKYFFPFYRDIYAGGWRHKFITEEMASEPENLVKDRFLIGNPEEVIAGIERLVASYGVTHLICRLFVAGVPHQELMKELQLLAKEVMPAFR